MKAQPDRFSVGAPVCEGIARRRTVTIGTGPVAELCDESRGPTSRARVSTGARRRSGWVLLAGLATASASLSAHADAVRVGYAHGQNTDDYGVEVRFDRDAPLREFTSSLLTTAVDVGAGVFQGHKEDSAHNNVKTLFVTGTIRWSRAPTGRVQPFAEFGLGLSGLTEQSINGDRHFGSSFEFNELIRLGLRFGERRQYEVTVGGQHFSNAGLHPPNDGITYAAVTAAWYWR